MATAPPANWSRPRHRTSTALQAAPTRGDSSGSGALTITPPRQAGADGVPSRSRTRSSAGPTRSHVPAMPPPTTRISAPKLTSQGRSAWPSVPMAWPMTASAVLSPLAASRAITSTSTAGPRRGSRLPDRPRADSYAAIIARRLTRSSSGQPSTRSRWAYPCGGTSGPSDTTRPRSRNAEPTPVPSVMPATRSAPRAAQLIHSPMVKADASLTKAMRAGEAGSAARGADPTSTPARASNLPTSRNRPMPTA